MNNDKFQNKYRIPSARWAAWDYSSNAAYFVTICVANRAHDFGQIQNGEMKFTPLGKSAQECWNEIPKHFPFVELGEFVVMPNHVHGVIVIAKPVDETVETQNFASLQMPHNHFGPQSQNLASIVRGYKIGVTKFARQNNIPFAWQPRYHDRVIRNAAEHERINQYIVSNPLKWGDDEFYG
jgi:REP element-mobilizing transposase RayT